MEEDGQQQAPRNGRRVRFSEAPHREVLVPERGEEVAEDEDDEDDDDQGDGVVRARRKRQRLITDGYDDDDDDDEDERQERRQVNGDDEDDPLSGPRLRNRQQNNADVDLDDGEDEDDDGDSRVRRMSDERVVGEEDETGERYNEAGERIEPFNLRAERANDGFFDENGNFVWRAERDEPDAWVAHALDDEANAEKAIGEAALRRRRQNTDDDDDAASSSEAESSSDERDAEAALAELLEPGETVAAALRRLGKKMRDDDLAKRRFEECTTLADALVRSGRRVDAYDATRDALLSRSQKSGTDRARDLAASLADDADDDADVDHLVVDPRQWEYRADDGQIYGPFPTSHILAWRAAGFFAGDRAVPMRLAQSAASSEQALPDTTAAAGTTTTAESKEDEKPKPKSGAEDFLDDFENDDDDDDDDEAQNHGGGGGATGTDRSNAGDENNNEDVDNGGPLPQWQSSDDIDFSWPPRPSPAQQQAQEQSE